MNDGLLSVHVRAKDVTGRIDEDLGVVPFPETMRGDVRANTIMKAVTKAKRRVTLSISGLGFLDETEVETIPGAKKSDPVALRPTSKASIAKPERSPKPLPRITPRRREQWTPPRLMSLQALMAGRHSRLRTQHSQLHAKARPRWEHSGLTARKQSRSASMRSGPRSTGWWTRQRQGLRRKWAMTDRTQAFDKRFSLSQQIEEVKRELVMRSRVYPSFVLRGKMRASEADFHMDRMRAVLHTLEKLMVEEVSSNG